MIDTALPGATAEVLRRRGGQHPLAVVQGPPVLWAARGSTSTRLVNGGGEAALSTTHYPRAVCETRACLLAAPSVPTGAD